MAKFLLIDSNIAGSGGHYLEYAEQVLESIALKGFECHLAGNRAFKQQNLKAKYASHSVFTFDMWGRNLSERATEETNTYSEADHHYLRHIYSRAGLIWRAASSLDSTRHYAQQTTLPGRLARRLLRAHDLQERMKGLPDLPEVDDDPVSSEVRRARQYQRFRERLRAASLPGPIASPADPTLAHILKSGRAADSYGAAIGELLASLAFGDGDHVFIPTLSIAEARAVRDLLRGVSHARKPKWSLLFRRDVFDGYSVSWPTQEWQAHEARNLFASFIPLYEETSLAFFTDTDRLTEQYERLGSVPFRTTVIPVRTAPPAARNWLQGGGRHVVVLCPPNDPAAIHAFATVLESLGSAETARIRFTVAMREADHEVRDDLNAAHSRLRPFLGDVVTTCGDDADLAALARSADGCLAFAIREDLLPDECRRLQAMQAQNLPVLSIDASNAKAGALVPLATYWLRGMLSDRVSTIKRREPIVLGYLGDARSEKGFHLLPKIIKGLFAGSDGGQEYGLNAQVYHPNPETDVRMLQAMETLRLLPRSQAQLKEGALSSEAYQKIISGSDLIFNLYSRHNYISRSSGVFVEALANLKPVVTMAGTWMSGLMGDWSKPYHDLVLAGARLLKGREMRRHGDWSFLGATHHEVSNHGPLQLKPGMSAVFAEHAPQGADNFRLEVSIDYAADVPIDLIVAWQGEDGVTFREARRCLNRATPGTISLVFPIPSGAAKVWVGLSQPHFMTERAVEWARVSWLAVGKPVAELPGGIAIRDGDDEDLTGDSIAAIQAIGAALPAYLDSCDWIHDRWAGLQTAAAFAEDVLHPAPLPSQGFERFVGVEW